MTTTPAPMSYDAFAAARSLSCAEIEPAKQPGVAWVGAPPKPRRPAATARQTAAQRKAAAVAGDRARIGDAQSVKWPHRPSDLLVRFLNRRVSDAADAPNRGLPFITEAGVVRFTGTAWREFLLNEGIAVSKKEAAQPLREMGFVVRAFSIPGEGRSLAMYLGQAPKGTEKLPRRKVERRKGGGDRRNPVATISRLPAAHRRVLLDALMAAPRSAERDELLAHLPTDRRRATTTRRTPRSLRTRHRAAGVATSEA